MDAPDKKQSQHTKLAHTHPGTLKQDYPGHKSNFRKQPPPRKPDKPGSHVQEIPQKRHLLFRQTRHLYIFPNTSHHQSIRNFDTNPKALDLAAQLGQFLRPLALLSASRLSLHPSLGFLTSDQKHLLLQNSQASPKSGEGGG